MASTVRAQCAQVTAVALGTSHAEPTQRGAQPMWESIRITFVTISKIQLHDQNTCLVGNPQWNWKLCFLQRRSGGMEGHRHAEGRALRGGTAHPVLLSVCPRCLQRSAAALKRPAPLMLGFTDPAAGQVMLCSLRCCAPKSYSYTRLCGSCMATAKQHLGCSIPPDPPLCTAAARLHLQNKWVWKYWMQGLDQGRRLPAWKQPRLFTSPEKCDHWLLPANSTKPQPRPPVLHIDTSHCTWRRTGCSSTQQWPSTHRHPVQQ